MHEMSSYSHALYHSRHDCYCYRCGCYKNCCCWYDDEFYVEFPRDRESAMAAMTGWTEEGFEAVMKGEWV